MKNLSSKSLEGTFYEKLKKFRALEFSLRLRLYIFLALAVLTIAALLFFILFASGFLDSVVSDKHLVFSGELEHIASTLEKRLGLISSTALRMGARISKNTENFLGERNMTPNDLRLRTEVLNDLLASEFDNVMFSLAQSRTTGAFMILNSTVSARMKDAMFSRAGLYILNWEPDLIVSSTQQFQLLRGPSRIAIERELVMEKYWAMEFDIADSDYFTMPQKYAAVYPKLAPQICLWNSAMKINNSTYKAMLCSVPLTDFEGNVFGVCGFDISELYFRRTFGPTVENFKNIFCALAPLDEGRIDLSHAMISWRHLVEDEPDETTTLIPVKNNRFNLYTSNTGTEYVGLHKTLKLQPAGLPFDVQEFALALLVPRKDFDAIKSGQRAAIIGIFAVVSIAGALISFIFNKIYVRPIIEAIGAVSDSGEGNAARSPDIAIDKNYLLKLTGERKPLAPRKITGETAADTEPGEEFWDMGSECEFAGRIKTLTAAERKVFDLYIQGYTASDISRALNISLNTVKTHNKNIMAKMQAASKRELISANIKMLKDGNQARQE
ncbi:MAG: LuxR C-terminal-related transcriptional regulator [Synergistaceae bacterium]|jgi:DNA-binding CsgD family transcriptional regulator|nr:LuxR C-terminal-related transcriptional regulator [Synergistaceae bacterium]